MSTQTGFGLIKARLCIRYSLRSYAQAGAAVMCEALTPSTGAPLPSRRLAARQLKSEMPNGQSPFYGPNPSVAPRDLPGKVTWRAHRRSLGFPALGIQTHPRVKIGALKANGVLKCSKCIPPRRASMRMAHMATPAA